MTPRPSLSHVLTLLVSSFSLALQTSRTLSSNIRLELTHIDAATNFSTIQLLQLGVHRSKQRAVNLINNPTAGQFQSTVHAGSGEYLMSLAIGTPTVPFTAILDTGSDLTWTQCEPCEECFSQPSPIFDPSRSTTFSNLSCSNNLCKALANFLFCDIDNCMYGYPYTDGSFSRGFLGSDIITSGPNDEDSFPDIAFGCGISNQIVVPERSSGFVGLGRGNLSLVSQLGIQQFSYCFTSFGGAKQSTLLFGSLADLNISGSDPIKSTPIIRNLNRPYFYYLNLQGITVGETKINIQTTSFAIKADGSGGFIIDSGTFITYLEDDAYEKVKQEFMSRIQLPVADGYPLGLDLCYAMPRDSSPVSLDLPRFVLHFDGVDLDLPVDNYFSLDSENGLLCLMVAGSNGGMSILGNFQQQNMIVLYDLHNGKLSFVPAQCDHIR